MAAYGAYALITWNGATRTPFLLEGISVHEFAGPTAVAVIDGASQPDLLLQSRSSSV